MTATPFRFVAALAGVALFAGCGGHAEEEAAAKAVVAATVDSVVPGPFDLSVEATGSVVARAGHVAALSAPIGARIARVLAVPGQRVRAGDLLVELDRSTIDPAARGADAVVSAAEAAAARAERLVTAGILPRRDAEQATADLARARAEAATAHRAAELARLVAPFDGVVLRVAAAPGATADPNVALVELADPSALDLVFTVSPADAARLAAGQRVTVFGASGGDTVAVASVADVGGLVDSTSRGVAVRATIRSSTRTLRLGESVIGRIAVAHLDRAITVPLEALVPSGEGFHVFVIDSAGVAAARDVTVGARTATRAQILDGLVAGERIATAGAYGLDDGATIAAPPAKPSARP